MSLLVEGALSAGCDTGRISTVANELEAVTHCLTSAREGDLVVVTADDIEAVWAQVQAFVPSSQAETKKRQRMTERAA